jgi:spore germination cell wall hydrolase CwlJ-like protein
VCLAPLQFSCRNKGDPNAAKIDALTLPAALADAAFLDCLAAAAEAMSGRVKPMAPGILHYHVAGITPLPAWAVGQTPVGQLGAHVFYNSVR